MIRVYTVYDEGTFQHTPKKDNLVNKDLLIVIIEIAV